jgi:hypothetical protein
MKHTRIFLLQSFNSSHENALFLAALLNEATKETVVGLKRSNSLVEGLYVNGRGGNAGRALTFRCGRIDNHRRVERR